MTHAAASALVRLLVLGIAAAAGGCSRSPGDEPALPPDVGGVVPSAGPMDTAGRTTAAGEDDALPGRAAFTEAGLRFLPESRSDLRARLGQPDSIRLATVPNRHMPGVTDTMYTVFHPDLVARFHHPGGGGDLLSMLQVSSNRHLRHPIIGRSVADVDAAFGRPDEASDSSLTYHCTSCVAGDNPVQLVLEDGAVSRVRFNFYVD